MIPEAVYRRDAELAEALRHRDDPKWRAWLEKFSDTPQQRTARWHLLLAQ